MCYSQSNKGKTMSQHVEKIRMLLDQGSALHQLGKLEEAKLIYESILKINIKQCLVTSMSTSTRESG